MHALPPVVPAVCLVLAVSLLGHPCSSAHAQSVRDRTRLKGPRQTVVTPDQATELTLTVTDVAVRPIQVWIRTSGTIDENGRTLTCGVPAGQAARLRVGQRGRVFSPESRSRMYQAEVARVDRRGETVSLIATVRGRTLEASRHYVLEVVTEDGDFLSVPNEAIILSGGRTLVYVRAADGEYSPRDIKPGVQGELFTQVLDGLKPGEQVVTIGSFFIDADQKLKGS